MRKYRAVCAFGAIFIIIVSANGTICQAQDIVNEMGKAGITEQRKDTSNPAVPAGTRIQWLGNDWFLHSVNIPWYNWGRDFGGGSTNGGVTDPVIYARREPDNILAQAA